VISWAAPANTGGTPLTGFKVKWDGSGSMLVLDSSISPNTFQFSATAGSHGVVTGNSYSFIVVASNVVGDSVDSTTLANIIAATPPSVPLNFVRNGLVTPVATSITVSWDAPSSDGGSALTAYKLYWDQGLGGLPLTLIVTNSASIRFYTIDGLTKAHSYIFKVLAVNAVGDGPATASLTLLAA